MKRREFFVHAGSATVALSAASSAAAVAGSASTSKEAPEAPVRSTGNKGSTESSASRPLGNVLDPSYIDARLDSRAVNFENPTGARGSEGHIGNGRKRHPFHILEPGEKVILADLTGPGTLRHFWTMLSNLSPEVARAQRLEVFYDGLTEPSISVPILDFFGLPHGRVTEYYSALISINNGRGFNSHIPMPFQHSIRIEYTNESRRHVLLYYQIDYTLERSALEEPSYLHVSFRRENPTILRRDFVIAEGFKGPGRFLGCSVGMRLLEEGWYGEGEVKIYRDGDTAFPTYCGTGVEDYVGSAWGMFRHYGPYSGVPINVLAPSSDPVESGSPKFVGFYRWHLPDPIMFSDDLRVTIQQIGGGKEFKKGEEAAYAAYKAQHIAAGPGWTAAKSFRNSLGSAIVERSDDYCAAAFVYCRSPQSVPRYATGVAIQDIGFLPLEQQPVSMMPEDEWEAFSIEFKKDWEAKTDRGK